MVLISFTNLVVDQFSYASRNPLSRLVYFLTHMHADHYAGLSNSWDYGPIYCSPVTKGLLEHKYPGLRRVIALELGRSHVICLSEEEGVEVEVNLFDSNHCAGSVMLLFRGYFGTILHTGDMRFNRQMIESNPVLFPTHLGGKSIPVDEVIFDNTYCDPVFQFPERSKALEMMVALIESHRGKRVFLCTDSIGKEEIFLVLAEHFQTLIVVNEERLVNIGLMGLDLRSFTTVAEEGWIEVIRKGEKAARMKQGNCISVTLTGWANVNFTYSSDYKNYIIPYSLHSNFRQLQLFMQAVLPACIHPVVRQNRSAERINNITEFSGYINTLHYLKQRGIQFFKEKYLTPARMSEQYRRFSQSVSEQQRIRKLLKVDLDEEERVRVDEAYFNARNKIKPAKLKPEDSRPNKIKKVRKEDIAGEIMEIKKRLEEKKVEVEEKARREAVLIESDGEDKKEQQSQLQDQSKPARERVTLNSNSVLYLLQNKMSD